MSVTGRESFSTSTETGRHGSYPRADIRLCCGSIRLCCGSIRCCCRIIGLFCGNLGSFSNQYSCTTRKAILAQQSLNDWERTYSLLIVKNTFCDWTCAVMYLDMFAASSAWLRENMFCNMKWCAGSSSHKISLANEIHKKRHLLQKSADALECLL